MGGTGWNDTERSIVQGAELTDTPTSLPKSTSVRPRRPRIGLTSAVDVHLGQPVPQRIHDQLQPDRVADIE